MAGDRSSGKGRAQGLVPLARLPLPPGSPGRLWAHARHARIRQALGPALASQLVEIQGAGERVVLTFAGAGWERALAATLADVERRVASALGVTSVTVEVRSDPRRSVNSSFLPAGSSVDSSRDPRDPIARLRRAAQRILERRARER